MKFFYRIALAIGVILFVHASGFAQFGKGVNYIPKDSTFSIKFSARFQTLYNGELNLETDEWSDNIMIRRSRFKFDGFIHDPRLKYKLELGISNRDIGKVAEESNLAANIIVDAVLKYEFMPGWELWFGQTKLPGNRERIVSSQKMQFVDRSQLNSKYTLDRGTGIQLHHRHSFGKAVLKEKGSISMGEGRNFTADNIGGYEFTGRIEYLPMGEFMSKGDYFGADLKREQSPKLAIGVTYDQNNNTTRVQGFKGDFLSEARDQQAVFVDAMFKYSGVSAMFEYASKSTDKSSVIPATVVGEEDEVYQTGTGTNISLGYLFKNNFEIAGRFTAIRPEDNNWGDDYNELTLGLSRYIVGHNLKVQSDLTLVDHMLDEDVFRFRFQVEMAF